jgi:hypothetical protein
MQSSRRLQFEQATLMLWMSMTMLSEPLIVSFYYFGMNFAIGMPLAADLESVAQVGPASLD